MPAHQEATLPIRNDVGPQASKPSDRVARLEKRLLREIENTIEGIATAENKYTRIYTRIDSKASCEVLQASSLIE